MKASARTTAARFFAVSRQRTDTFATDADRASVTLTTDFGPGSHESGYWVARIQGVLEWLPLKGPGTTV